LPRTVRKGASGSRLKLTPNPPRKTALLANCGFQANPRRGAKLLRSGLNNSSTAEICESPNPCGPKMRLLSCPRFSRRREIFVTQPEVQHEIWTDLPVVLDKSGVVCGAEIALGISRQTGAWVCINTFENRSVVGKIPEAGERINWPCASCELIIALFPADVAAKLEGMAAQHLADDVPQVVSILCKDARRGLAARSPKPNAIKSKPFHLQSRNTEVNICVGIDVIVSAPPKARLRVTKFSTPWVLTRRPSVIL
jgi:hypothetical protein